MDVLDLIIAALLLVLIFVLLRNSSGYADVPSGAIVLADSTGITPNGTPVPVLNQPVINTSGPVQFTLAFNLKLTDVGGTWKEIIQNVSGTSWNNGIVPGANSPLVFIFPPQDPTQPPAGTVGVRMGVSSGATDSIQTFGSSAPLVPNQPTHITMVADTNVLRLYINGTKVNEATTAAGVTLKYPPVNNYTWNNTGSQLTGQATIKNGFWWSRALSDAEVATLPTATLPAPAAPVAPVAPVVMPPPVVPGMAPPQIGDLTMGGPRPAGQLAPNYPYTYGGSAKKVMIIDI
jgi:Concanavalin A-like lectin/glucanases superfamily